jgi:hypothetical protein
VPLFDWAAIDFTFTDEEVEKLAEMEHDTDHLEQVSPTLVETPLRAKTEDRQPGLLRGPPMRSVLDMASSIRF